VAFFLAETVAPKLGFQISGIMTLVALGLFMSAFGKTRIHADTEHAVHNVWSYVVYAAETIIFFLAGVIVGNNVLNDKNGYIRFSDYTRLLLLYLIINIVRYISLFIFAPIICKTGYGCTIRELVVIAWGGLRGAIGIFFAMIASVDPGLDPILRDILLFDMTGIAILTLIINATLTGPLIDYLGILVQNRVKEEVFKNFLEAMIEESEHK